jgi:2,3-bisphosphoglycerate-dependent phosphoglycerate mutase
MNIYFVRHGESEANLLKEFSNRGWKHPLTAKGSLQAHDLAARLNGIHFSRVYTSPLMRAVQTAHILAKELAVAYEVTDALREFDMGVAEGKRDPENWALWQLAIDNWLLHAQVDFCVEGGESFTDMRQRFVPFIDQLQAQYGGAEHNLLCVGHGALYTCMLPLVLANVQHSDLFGKSFPNTAYVLAVEKPSGLVCLEWCGEKWPLEK